VGSTPGTKLFESQSDNLIARLASQSQRIMPHKSMTRVLSFVTLYLCGLNWGHWDEA
jgi:hypothetical protein